MRALSAIGFLCVLLTPFIIYGQKPAVNSATEQHWSGGIAGRWGARYTFKIAFPADRMPTPDTIWIGAEPIALSVGKPGADGNTIVTKHKKEITWDISVSTTHDDMYAPDDNSPVYRVPKYQGVVLLQYRFAGVHRSFAVKKFTTHYPTLSYP